MRLITEAAAWLKKHDDFLIMTHRRPDGDAVGSAAALCLGLRALGKKAELFPNTQFTDKFRPLWDGLLGSGDPEGKTVIAVDMAAETMLPYNAPGMAGKIVFSLDHHGSNSHYAESTFVDAHAAACGELVYLVLTELGVTLTKEMAEAIYVALSTDTGCFRFTNVTAQTYRVAAACLQAGADTAYWNRLLFMTRTAPRLKLEAYLTETAEFFAGGKVCICTLPQEKETEFGLSEDDLDDISGFPRDIEGVEVGVMIRDVADGAKVSLRTFAPWDASAICEKMGGGGHAAAAGATVKGTMAEAKTAALDAIRAQGLEV